MIIFFLCRMALKAKIVKRPLTPWMFSPNLHGNVPVKSMSESVISGDHEYGPNLSQMPLAMQERQQRPSLASLQSNRYKPYETARNTNQVHHPVISSNTPTFRIPGSSQATSNFANGNRGPTSSIGVIPPSVTENVTSSPASKSPAVNIPPNSQSLNQNLPSLDESQQTLVEKTKAGQPTAVVQAPNSGPAAEASKTPQQQPVVSNKSFVNASVSHKSRTASSKRRQQQQILHHLMEIIQIQASGIRHKIPIYILYLLFLSL